ncbi:pectate lyase [Parapedobacter deserti]|uniref:Pectate lyase n=1 Tax=Parapedobacter deserti TaxID=1912957 RepID=A0ABV7JID3_9SPHI
MAIASATWINRLIPIGAILWAVMGIATAQPATVDSIAERMVILQRSYGGWSKTFNGKAVDYSKPLDNAAIRLAREERDARDATIDNGATAKEIVYLLEAYQKTGNTRYADAARRGVDYLLEAQYPGGGWPQYYPDTRVYRSQITYNDDAIINVLSLLRTIAGGSHNAVFTADYREKVQQAIARGVQNILATQVVIGGRKTIWAAQYDKDTLKPATARSYELPSLATAESANILMFLMALEHPSEAVQQAVRCGARWFKDHAIEGYAVKIIDAPGQPTGKDRILAEAPGEILWARFYDLKEQKPLFAGRDGRPRRRMEDVENERRVGYSWYGGWGDKVLKRYKKWLKGLTEGN